MGFCAVDGDVDDEEGARRVGVGNARFVRSKVEIMRRRLGECWCGW